MEPKSTPGGARRAENSLWEFSGPPPGGTREFFPPPEASKSDLGMILYPTEFTPGAWSKKRPSKEPSRRPF